MGEVSASVSGVAQKEEDAVDAAALSDWEMKSRLAKDRARRRKREKQARQERASVYVDGEINDDDAAMAKSGAFSLTAIPGRLAEFGGEDVESNMFGRRSSSVDHNEDEKVEDDLRYKPWWSSRDCSSETRRKRSFHAEGPGAHQ